MKDLFSEDSSNYAKFRPGYPDALFDYLLPLVENKQTAHDCGTGNGQVAINLAEHFNDVYATDISEKQLAEAEQKINVHYSVQAAESTTFESNQFDLITVAQAVHWFNFDQFYKEVNRTLKPGGIIALIGYGLIETAGELNDVINHFYKNIVGPYWDKERDLVDEHYQTIPFPFDEINSPTFKMEYEWTIDQLTGYLGTWSAVKHYKKTLQKDPIEEVLKDFQTNWGEDAIRSFTFPIFLRVGRKLIST